MQKRNPKSGALRGGQGKTPARGERAQARGGGEKVRVEAVEVDDDESDEDVDDTGGPGTRQT